MSDLLFLQDLSLKQILEQYPLPKRLLAYFTSQCIQVGVTFQPNPNPIAIKAIDMAERYGNGEDFTEEEWNNNPFSFTKVCSLDYWVIFLVNSSAQLFNKDAEYFKPLLLSLIDKRLSKVEKILIFGNYSCQ